MYSITLHVKQEETTVPVTRITTKGNNIEIVSEDLSKYHYWPHNLVEGMVHLWTGQKPEDDDEIQLPHELAMHILHLKTIIVQEDASHYQKKPFSEREFEIQTLIGQWFNNGINLYQCWLAKRMTNPV